MESTPREARREIRDHLPELVYQYLRYIKRKRAWVTSTLILKHFNLGRRESLVVQELLEIKERGPKELLKPENLIRTDIRSSGPGTVELPDTNKFPGVFG